MAWLNSKVGHDDEVTNAYIPIKRKGRTFDILGRQITIGKSGLPQEINTFFDANNQHLKDKSSPILSDDVRFIIETSAGNTIKLKSGELEFTKEVNSTLKWKVTNRSKELELTVLGVAEFDGFMSYELQLTSLADLEIKDIRLELPITNEMSGYYDGDE